MKNNIIFSPSKGKEFSKVSREIIEKFNLWLSSSRLELDVFEDYANSDNFQISLVEENNALRVFFLNNENVVGLEFIESEKSADNHSEFFIEVSLLLMHINSLLKGDKNKDKIIGFIRENGKKYLHLGEK